LYYIYQTLKCIYIISLLTQANHRLSKPFGPINVLSIINDEDQFTSKFTQFFFI
jgi:hypothetical protein